jgi:cathepsin D
VSFLYAVLGGNIIINDRSMKTAYFSEVMFGSENKTFILVIDTGSSDTWIPSSKCTSEACKIHSTFGPDDSDTLKTTQKTFDIKYGSGDVMGTVVTDSVKFAGFELSLSFGLASVVSEDFVNFPIDGILGLGFSDGSQQKVPTIMDELVDKGLIKSKLFGIALSRHGDKVNDGVINFGGIDSGLFEGDLTFTPSVSDQGLWELKLDDVSVDGNTLGLTGKTTIIDTGTSLVIIFVPKTFSQFISNRNCSYIIASRSASRCPEHSLYNPRGSG